MNGNLRIVVLAALAAAAAAPAIAAPRDDVINEMLRCAGMADANARHACFDAAIPQLKAASQTAPVGETPATTAQAAPAQQQAASAGDDSWLGDWNPFKGGSSREPTAQQLAFQPMGAEILPITIGVADFSTGIEGYTVTLENGQVWRNHSRMGETPPFRIGEKNFVTIQHATLGGFHLLLNGRRVRYRVIRTK